MRKVYEDVLKTLFRDSVIKKRKELHMTQEQFSEKLEMTSRSYAEIERGMSCCSEVTLALYLIYYCDNVQDLIDELKVRFENANKNAA